MDRYAYVLEQLEADDYRRLRAFSADGQTKFSTWLVVVANRLCVDYHRKRYGRSRATSDTNPGAADSILIRRRLADLVVADVDHTRLPDRSGLDPESALAASEIGEALSRAIASLSAQDRLLLAFRFEHDATTRDLGDVMGFPSRFHAYRRLKQILTTLRLSLEEEGFEEGEP
jgi:RNA polymerase sigma factor (sigma-70 family)